VDKSHHSHFQGPPVGGGLLNRVEGQEWFTATNPATVDAQGRRYGGAFYAQLDHQLLQDVKLIAGFQTNKIAASLSTLCPAAA